jgi:hypothetical protein
VNPNFPEWDQRCTLAPNATEVQPYGALSSYLEADANVHRRDMVLAIRLDNGDSLSFPFLDYGGKPAVAECSGTAFVKLGGEVHPRPGGGTPIWVNNFQLIYLAFPNSAGQTPASTLQKFAQASNAEEFTTILAFIAKATADAVKNPRARTYIGKNLAVDVGGTNPLQAYERWKKLPENRQYLPDVIDLADLIDVALRDNGFIP